MPEKLLEFNKLEIANLMKNEKNHQFLIERIRKLVLKAFPERYVPICAANSSILSSRIFIIHIFFYLRKNDRSLQLDDHHIITTLKWAQNRISTLNDLVNKDLAFLWIVPASVPSIEQVGCTGTFIVDKYQSNLYLSEL